MRWTFAQLSRPMAFLGNFPEVVAEDDFLPVLVVTADSSTATKAQALAAGATAEGAPGIRQESGGLQG